MIVSNVDDENNMTLLGDAEFGGDKMQYRYKLRRIFPGVQEGKIRYLMFLMLNPSTADHVENDPTVQRCENRAKRMGYGGLLVCNLFGLRSTDPKELKRYNEWGNPVGERNDAAILECAKESEKIICGWGTHGSFHSRDKEVVLMLLKNGYDLYVLGENKSGTPKHPLYQRNDLTPYLWKCSVV